MLATFICSFKKKFKITGYDIDNSRVSELKSIWIEIENSKKDLKLNKGSLITSNHNDIKNSNFYIVTVPTPIKKINFPI